MYHFVEIGREGGIKGAISNGACGTTKEEIILIYLSFRAENLKEPTKYKNLEISTVKNVQTK